MIERDTNGFLKDIIVPLYNILLRTLQDMFDLPLHMARDQIEESLRTKMASIKVDTLAIRCKCLLCVKIYQYDLHNIFVSFCLR